MGREIKKVPVGFDWPLNKVWTGFVNPHYEHQRECPHCRGSGYSTFANSLYNKWYGRTPGFIPEVNGSTSYTADYPAVREFATRNVTRSPEYYGQGELAIEFEARRLAQLFNQRWSSHLLQEHVDVLCKEGRLMDFTHDFVPGEGWKKKVPEHVPTAKEVNDWNILSMGHDSINAHIVIKYECEKLGVSTTCSHCEGHGQIWLSEEAKAAAEAWKSEEPPEGPAYQVWETVSEGSPISPAFEDPEALADWMVSNCREVDKGVSREQWLRFIQGPGWAPSFVSVGGQLVSGVAAG